MRARRVLVTGAAGFLGSHLVDRLVARGERVTGLDDLSTGRASNLEGARASGRFDLVRGDVLDPLPEGPWDHVWHLACPASPPRYQADPIRTARICFEGTLNALRACGPGTRLFLASTSEVYGDPDVHPQPETYRGAVNPVGPRACYDEGKRVAETLAYDWRRATGLDLRVARIFNTYGPRMDPADGRVVSNLIVQALRGEAMTLYGGGAQTRSFCYVDDLIDGFLALMDAEAAPEGPVNLGNPDEFAVADLAALVAEKVEARTGRRAPVSARPLPQDDPRQRRPDIALAGTLLGWSPEVALAEGLDRTIAHIAGELATA